MTNYYELHYKDFVADTIDIDMSDIYQPFLSFLEPGATILDIGCGSGRDLLSFSNLGFHPIGIEPVESLAEKSRLHSKCKVISTDLENYKTHDEFDGIWACASLLHLQDSELAKALSKIYSLMLPQSVFYCSFKLGLSGRYENGRYFNDKTVRSFQELLPADLVIFKHWTTDDKRMSSQNKWLNILCRPSLDK